MTAPTSSADNDKLISGFRALVLAQLPQFFYAGVWEYKVTAATSSTIDGVPTDDAIPMPSVQGIPFKPSLLGEGVTPTVGSLALLMFANMDPTRPYVVSFNEPAQIATVDATATLNLGPSAAAVKLAGGGPSVGRVGDTVSVTFTMGDAEKIVPTVGGVAGTCALSLPITLTGTITSGSGKVTSG
jgi:hypothetical protein